MTYAPVCIPTLNRYEHLHKCLESLSRCTWADQTEVYVALDYPPLDKWDKYAPGWEKNRDWLRSVGDMGFKKLNIIEHKENLGAFNIDGRKTNYQYLRELMFNSFDSYIMSEDDNVFSPSFLVYMNTCLSKFKNDRQVESISGYNRQELYNQDGSSIYKSVDSSGWGVAYWTKKECVLQEKMARPKLFEKIIKSPIYGLMILQRYPALYKMLYDMVKGGYKWGDTMRTSLNIIGGTYQVRPSISLVRNCGNDGSGENCGINDLDKQEISQETTFDFEKPIGRWNNRKNREALYNQCLPEEELERKRMIRKIRNLYIHVTMPHLYNLIKLVKNICK